MEKKKIILASSSPRRIEIMRKQGLEPLIIPPDVDETLPFDCNEKEAVMYLALKKALAVEKIVLNQAADHNLIIAADTIVYQNKIIGKPSDAEDALQILQSLRNTVHYVITGVALLTAGTTKRRIFYERTKVYFKDYTDEEIRAYIATDEPWDKAGGYAIQGTFGKYVDHYEGDLDNVIGFPWTRITEEIELLNH